MIVSNNSGIIEFGTWVPTWTGFSVDPTISGNDAYYFVTSDGFCYWFLTFSAAGTSNAASLTFTLPKTAANLDNYQLTGALTNAGTRETGLFIYTANSNIMTVARINGSAITASGSKSCAASGVFKIA